MTKAIDPLEDLRLGQLDLCEALEHVVSRVDELADLIVNMPGQFAVTVGENTAKVEDNTKAMREVLLAFTGVKDDLANKVKQNSDEIRKLKIGKAP